MKEKTLKYSWLYLSPRQIEALKEEARKKQISYSEWIRRILDKHLDDKIKR